MILRRPPLVEYIFEIRWNHPDGLNELYTEHELMLGKIHEHMEKSDYPEVQRHPGFSREAFLAFGRTEFITHRFLRQRPDNENSLTYPLRQYGIGMATLNVDKHKYNWKDFQSESIKYFRELNSIHKNFASKIQSISLRSVDFFESETISESFYKIIKASMQHQILSLPEYQNTVEIPTFQTLIKLPSTDTSISIRAASGKVEDTNGVILEINGKTNLNNPTETMITDSLQAVHGLIGNAFFAIVTKEEIDARL